MTGSLSPRLRGRPAGFTLVEMLTVIGILALLLSLTFPAMRSAYENAQINRAAQQFGDALQAARMLALSRNAPMAMRLWEDPGTGDYQSFQLWSFDENLDPHPHDRLIRLPAGIVFSPLAAHSSLLASPPASGTGPTGGGATARYVELLFRRDGRLDADPDAHWYITLLPEAEKQKAAPVHYRTFLIDPSTGISSVFEP